MTLAAAAAATLALMGAADDPGYVFARSLARAGPRTFPRVRRLLEGLLQTG